jgi:hypothetical protein
VLFQTDDKETYVRTLLETILTLRGKAEAAA